jgi:alpha-L-fucosidase 2
VWDYFDYTQDAEWYQHVGYPLLKGVVQFWLSTLVEDEYFKDGTLVSNPCYSAEHGNAVSPFYTIHPSGIYSSLMFV